MITAEWSRVGSGLFGKADAQKVAEEILLIGDEVKPAQIVERAKDESSELHKCFTWDDQKAAEQWRLQQARSIVGCLIIHREEKYEDKPEVHYFHKNDSGGYKPATYVFTHADEHEKLLQAAYAELAAFKRKYSNLQELDWILEQLP